MKLNKKLISLILDAVPIEYVEVKEVNREVETVVKIMSAVKRSIEDEFAREVFDKLERILAYEAYKNPERMRSVLLEIKSVLDGYQ
jgi:hypothetical protein